MRSSASKAEVGCFVLSAHGELRAMSPTSGSRLELTESSQAISADTVMSTPNEDFDSPNARRYRIAPPVAVAQIRSGLRYYF